MQTDKLQELLQQFKFGHISLEETLSQLKQLPFQDLTIAKIDRHRALRCGFPEVIYAEHKTMEDFRLILQTMLAHQSDLLVTRASPEYFEAVRDLDSRLHYHPRSKTMTLMQQPREERGSVMVVSAGTADIPVAEEAYITAQMMHCKVTPLYDVGVAGLHRLIPHLEALQKTNVIVVVAGMEGALASVVGGLVDCPVIAVPTSIGYGAHFHGLATLLAMLNSCAAGVSVVNIDNGFGAGYTAALINQKICQSTLSHSRSP